MDRQLTIEPIGDFFHLHFHNYAGPEEGHRISGRLGVEEIEPPEEEPDPTVLKPGQCFLWHPMGFNPDLHALVTKEKLTDATALVRELHINVTQGRELLPALADDEPGTKTDSPGPEGDADEHHDLGYVEMFEKRHESVWHRGPKAVLGAFLLRAIPAVIAIGILIVASRHFGDHHREVTIDAVFARARTPNVEQTFFQGLMRPDHSYLLRTKILAVRYLQPNQMILADGNFLAIEGLGDLRTIFDRAQEANTPPVLDITVRDGRVHIEQITLGSAIVGEDATLVRLAQLGPSANVPQRGSGATEGEYREFQEIYYDNNEILDEVDGQRISLLGHLESDGDRLVLRMPDGGGMVLKESRRSTKAAKDFIKQFTGSGAEVRADMLLDTVYPWKNRREPDTSREASKLLGEATLHSFSVQNYHLLARR